MLSRQPEFRLNDLICRRYPGAYRHPLDPELLGLPWWLKEAIGVLAAGEEAAVLDSIGAETWPPRTP